MPYQAWQPSASPELSRESLIPHGGRRDSGHLTVILLQDATPLPSWDEMNSFQAHPHAEDNSNWDPVKTGFYTIARIPNIMEAIDCTHITLRPPAGKEYLFQEPQGIPFNERSDHLLCHHAHDKCAL